MSDEWTDWIDHDGKGCPVHKDCLVEVMLRSGGPYTRDSVAPAHTWEWPWGSETKTTHPGDIMQYRIRQPSALQELKELADNPKEMEDA